MLSELISMIGEFDEAGTNSSTARREGRMYFALSLKSQTHRRYTLPQTSVLMATGSSQDHGLP